MPPSSQLLLSFKYPTEVARDLWVATSEIWGVVAVGFQRGYLREAGREPTSRPDAKRYLNSTGIYILRGEASITGSTRIYVGKGSRVGARLQNHAHPENDWWTEAVAIVSRYDEWDSSQAGFLEARLYDLAVKARSCVLMNDNRPGGDDLTDHKGGVAEQLFKNVERCLPALSYPEFILPSEAKPSRKRGASLSRNATAPSSSLSASAATASSPKSRKATASAGTTTWEGPPEAEFRFAGKHYHAYGRRRPSGEFEVLPGSRAALSVSEKCPQSARDQRNRHMRSGAIEERDDHLFFRGAAEFGSASAAAQAVAGFSISGKIAWRTRDGRQLGDL